MRCKRTAPIEKDLAARIKVQQRGYYELRRHDDVRRYALTLIFLGGMCELCGHDNLDHLECDHIQRRNKSFSIGAVTGPFICPTKQRHYRMHRHGLVRVTMDQYWNEVAKCRVLCLFCHRDHTRRENAAMHNSLVVSAMSVMNVRLSAAPCDADPGSGSPPAQ